MARHKAMTFLRERDVAELVLAEGLDDLKALLVGDGINIEEILKIETRVIDDIRNIERMTKAFAGPEDFKLDRKSFVMKHKDLAGPYFGMLMHLYSGKTPDYQGFFEKHILKQYYGLRQLVLVPTVAEAD